MKSDKENISVIGAGFAGLTVALALIKKGHSVDIYEKSNRLGGLLGTDATDFGIAEKAANALIRTRQSEELFQQLGLKPSFNNKTSSKRFIFRKKPKQWPLNFCESLCFVIKFLPRFLFARSSMAPLPIESLELWGQRNLGVPATKYILEPAMQGIYGNKISELSSKLILGALFDRILKKVSKDPQDSTLTDQVEMTISHKKNLGKTKYKGLLTGPGGMQDLIDHLEIALKSRGVRIHLNSTPNLKELNGPVVIATSAPAAAKILEDSFPRISQILKKVRMCSVISTTVFFNSAQTKYQGFGCLMPQEFKLKSLGVLMNSYIFADRNKTYNETWILGGTQAANLLKLSDKEIIDLIQAERMTTLAASSEVLSYRINRWPQALPHYDLELEAVLEELNIELSNVSASNGIFLHGNYLKGIGLSKILENSESVATTITHHMEKQHE